MKEETSSLPFDFWLRRLQDLYPQQAVTHSHLTMTGFIDALTGEPDGPVKAWARMLDNLENQIAGHQWRVKGMIPRLDRWLREGLWKQRHEASPVSTLINDKTARTLSSAADFVKGGDA